MAGAYASRWRLGTKGLVSCNCTARCNPIFLMPFASKSPTVWSFRLILVCLAALSASLPMAWISLSKILLFVFGLGYLIANHAKKNSDTVWQEIWTTRIILATVIAFAASLLWTEVDMDFALHTLVKHAKLVTILLLISLIRTQHEARIGVTAFAMGQVFVLLASWLMAVGVPLPWAAQSTAQYVVFAESYIDQSIMLAATAAIFWHLRSEQLWPRWFAAAAAVAALLNVFLLLPGRTGYLIAMAMLSLTAMWALNRRMKMVALVVTPLVIVLGLYFSSGQVKDRITQAVSETQNYSQQVETKSSSGWRLNAWHRSIQAIRENPWMGHGVGSWTPAVKHMEGATATQVFGTSNSSNPHQEYLLWGVEIGVAGMLLLMAFLSGAAWDAKRFPPGIQRATLSMLVAIAIACLFNSALFDDLMGDFLCISLGLVMALGLTRAPSQKGQHGF